MSHSIHSDQNVLRGMLLICIAVIVFAAMDTLSKYLAGFYPVTYVLFARYLFHTVLITASIAPRQGRKLVRTSRPAMHIVRGLLLTAASLFFVNAIKYMPIAEATAIQFVSPLLVTLLAVVFLGEKVELSRWLAVGTGFVGVLIVIRPGAGVFTWAAILPLGTAAMFALYQILTRLVAGRESPYTLIFYPGLIGTLIFGLTLPFSWAEPKGITHLALLALAGMLSGSGHLILIKAYEQAPASRLSPFSYTQLIWVTLGGYLVFDHLPDTWSFVGIATLIGSGLYVATHQRRLKPAV
jgi:drug/metabolite transporter (DMT)-like permease